MRVSGSQFCAQKIPFAGEEKQRVIADLFKVAVEDGAFLISMDGVFSGIDIDDEMTFVSPSKQGIGGSAEAFFEDLQPLTGREDLILESAECGLPGSAIKLFRQSQSERRVYPQMIGVIAVLIACRYLIDPLTQELKQRMVRMSRRSRVVNLGGSTTEDT
jgi:hypothetical protein